MLGLTWWGWAGLGVLAILALLAAARQSWRAGVRRELVEYLARAVAEITIVEARADRLELRLDGQADGGTFYLDRFYRQMTGPSTGDWSGRQGRARTDLPDGRRVAPQGDGRHEVTAGEESVAAASAPRRRRRAWPAPARHRGERRAAAGAAVRGRGVVNRPGARQ